ncbi:uncharacterized protein E1O_05950 [Burkholderiales bacterium GJ-E10]|nr:uncharacterized protein E1O_05950 [Burkholderiales bacterium GJ-E10]
MGRSLRQIALHGIPDVSPMADSLQHLRSAPDFQHRDILAAIRHLDTAADAHLRWLLGFLAGLACGDVQRQYAESDPAMATGFETWFTEFDRTLRRPADPLLRQVALKHRALSNCTAALRSRIGNGGITTAEFDRFADAAMHYHGSLRALERALIHEASMVDALTGIWNRSSLTDRLGAERDRMLRHGGPCSLAMMDLDHFKDVNDRHGHAAGDHVLRSVVDVAKRHLRRYDSIFRYGGEEFLFCLPNIAAPEAQIAMDRIREDIAVLRLPLPEGGAITITASFGIAEMDTHRPIETSVDRADRALLRAKSSGRNQVRVWDLPASALHADPERIAHPNPEGV